MKKLLLAAALACFAAGQPNLTGTWKLDPKRSDFGRLPAPQSMTSHVDHKEPNIQVRSQVVTADGEYASTYSWVTDGRENVNAVRGAEIKSNVVWRGPTLVVEARTANARFTDEWTVSADGKTLTISRTIPTPQGPASQRYVYDKQ